MLAVILNHLNLAVSDVQLARGFLVKYFGLDPGGKPGNDNIAFLRDENGMVLTLTNFDHGAEVKYPGAFHIGFIQESREKVDEVNRRLKDDGFAGIRLGYVWTPQFESEISYDRNHAGGSFRQTIEEFDPHITEETEGRVSSIVTSPPCSNTSGRPLPWTS